MATQTSSEYARFDPRAVHIGENRMHASIVATNTQSASDELWLFPIPARCFVTGGVIGGSQPAGVSGQAVIKLGTKEDDDYFGTYTVSGGAALSKKRLDIFSPVTVSSSDDLIPYERAVIATINSAPSATISLSLYVLLEYVMPGNIN